MAGISRRGFVAVSLAAGYTLAAGPIRAAAIRTSSAGLLASAVRIPTADAPIRGDLPRSIPGYIPGYRARPLGPGPFPVVLVVQEVFGVHEHIRDLCRRLAHEGYLAVAPELYARQGDVARMTDIKQIIGVVSRVPDAQVLADLDATRAWAKTDGGNDARLGITGFCWGGRIVWLYAVHSPRVRAAVAWYGRLRGVATPLQPFNPIDLVARLQAPVLGLYGGLDQGIPIADVEAMRAAMKAAGKSGEIVLYPNSPHAFNADYRDSYVAADARDGWAKLLQFFRRNGV